MTRMTTGLLWFGTSNGVFACAPQQACNVAVPNVDARVVFPVLDDNVSEIWCGTRGNGLLRIRLDPVFGPVVNQLDSEQGLPSQNVFAVLPLRLRLKQPIGVDCNKSRRRSLHAGEHRTTL